MKLLVTGGLGFIGSNFILKTLHENEGFDIVNVDAELAGSNIKNLSQLISMRISFERKQNINIHGLLMARSH